MKIKKIYNSIIQPLGKILNSRSNSNLDTYSCDYINKYIENYSTTETRIGTWIDDKPLYKRVYEIPETTINQSGSTVIGVAAYTSEIEPIDFYGLIKTQTSSYYYKLAYDDITASKFIRILGSSNQRQIQIVIKDANKAEIKVTKGYVVFIYTKTTD